ncbi:MAG TPA: hypothetical protein VL727_25915 [Puia sp.]|nr:hypothetical protein [Puia sp.]
MGEKISKATITDIARELNITGATVSRALNDHPGIGVIIPSAETNFFGSVVHGIEKVARLYRGIECAWDSAG